MEELCEFQNNMQYRRKRKEQGGHLLNITIAVMQTRDYGGSGQEGNGGPGLGKSHFPLLYCGRKMKDEKISNDRYPNPYFSNNKNVFDLESFREK